MMTRFTNYKTFLLAILLALGGHVLNAQTINNAALSAVATHSGGGQTAFGYGPDLYNDGNIPQPYTVTGTNMWGWVSTNGWIEFTWPTPRKVFRCVFHKADRPMTTCTVQYWDGSAYVNIATYSGTAPDVDSIDFPVTSTTRIRLQNVAGNSNPNHREIQVMEQTFVECDGAPYAGVAVASETLTCPGYPVRLMDTTHHRNNDSVIGFTWMWQESLDSILWADIAGTTDKDTLDIIATSYNVYYRMKVICTFSGDTSYSNVIHLKNAPPYACYCYSIATGGLTDTTDIGAFTIGNFSVNDGGPHTTNPLAIRGRTSRADLGIIQLYNDSTYDFMLYHTMPSSIHGDGKVTIFIDFNNNRQYDIPEERVYTGYTGITNFVLIDSFRIPEEVIYGKPVGMRVIINNDTDPNIPSDEACGPYESGETEDYVVQFSKAFSTGIGAIAGVSEFGVYPNPTTGVFNVNVKGRSFDKLVVSVTNITGQKVYEKAFADTGMEFSERINLGEQSAGVYFVEISADGEKMMQKLMVK